jgi:hypothetical protein
MKPTLSGISQLDAPPGPHSAQEEALDASEPRYAHPRGYADPIQSTYVRTSVNKIMTRFACSRRDSLVEMVQTIHLRDRPHAAELGRLHRARDRCVHVQHSIGSIAMIVVEVGLE